MKKLLLLLTLFVLAESVSAQRLTRKQRAFLEERERSINTWVGGTKGQLLTKWGEPSSAMDDGEGGQILTFRRGEQYSTTTSATVTSPTYNTAFGNANSQTSRHYTEFRFRVDANNRITAATVTDY